MSNITLYDKTFSPYISEEEIQAAVGRLSREIHDRFKTETPVFIGILNGSFMFMADFVRKYDGPCKVSFVKLASYQGTGTTGEVKQLIGVNEELLR